MKPQIIFYIVLVMGLIFILNYQTYEIQVNNFIYGYKTDYNTIYNSSNSVINPLTNNYTTIYTTTEIWTNHSPIFNKKTVETKITETKTETHIPTKQDYINGITITGTSKNDIDKVKETLYTTDIKILKYIQDINIHDTENVSCNSINAIGCSIYYYPIIEHSATIDVIASKYYLPKYEGNAITTLCGSFENTLNHEIGHIDGVANPNNDESEYYADNYANLHTKEPYSCGGFTDTPRTNTNKYGSGCIEYMCNFRILSNNTDFRALENIKRIQDDMDEPTIQKLYYYMLNRLNNEDKEYAIRYKESFFNNINKTEELKRY